MRNTTLSNRSKLERLEVTRAIPRHHADGPRVVAFLRSLDAIEAPVEQVLYSIGVALLQGHRTAAIEEFLAERRMFVLKIADVPTGVFDLLGSAYQYLLTKAESLRQGSFYTGRRLAEDLVADLPIGPSDAVLDPSCGSGNLLMACGAGPDQMVGVDSDPVAVMIATFNYYLKFPTAGPPRFHCADFFSWADEHADQRFDVIIGNPPYGATVDPALVRDSLIRSGESFSHFVELGHRMLSERGVLRYLVPEAMLNVTRHRDVREFLLDASNLRALRRHRQKFTGVMSDIYSIEVDRGASDDVLFRSDAVVRVSKEFIRSSSNRVLTPWSDDDVAIVGRVRERGELSLADSVFGLGVVTGDNRSKLLDSPTDGSELIYTGKEVHRFRLDEPTKHLVFDRASLQQVAPDEVYRAPEKLVYKVISRHLRFALDTTGALTTNSANLLIPKVPGCSPTAVMALLNTDIYSFIHLKLFGGVNKIAKASLIGLPLPRLSAEEHAELLRLSERPMHGGPDDAVQAFVHEELFGLSRHEIDHVRRALGRSVDGRSAPGGTIRAS